VWMRVLSLSDKSRFIPCLSEPGVSRCAAMADGRCTVEPLAGFQRPSGSAQVLTCGPDLLLLRNGSERVFVYSSREARVQAVYIFAGRVTQLLESPDCRCIFALCQNDGIYCTSLHQIGREPSPTATEAAPKSPVLVTVPPDACVLKDPGACSFAVLENALVAVACSGTAWQMGFYEVPAGSTGSCKKVEELCIPVLSAGCSSTYGGGEEAVPPVLCCIYPHGAKAKATAGSSSSHLFLEQVLFRLLFGVDAALLSSPIILCGLPDGRLCCLPLRRPGNPEAEGGESRVKVLHHLGQPIAFIGAWGAGGDDRGSSCLLVVGSSGRALLMLAEGEVEGRALEFRERHLSIRVQSACLGTSQLFYSTGSDLLAVQLCPSPSGDRPDLWTPALQPPVSLNVCSLIALSRPTETPAGAVKLFAVSLKGRLLRVTLPQKSHRAHGTLSAAQVGQKVRDLLAGIGNVSDRVSSLKSCIHLKNDALRNLNQVFNICCLLLPNQRSAGGGPCPVRPISCHVRVRRSCILQQEMLFLSCVLQNSSDYILEQGWTLCVQLIYPPYPLTAQGERPTKTYSFPFDKLLPGKNLEVTLPLAAESELALPVTVCCSLMYFLQSILGEEECRWTPRSQPSLSQLVKDSGYISLVLDTQTVDWLDCLWVGCPATQGSNSRPSSGSGVDLVQTLLTSSRKAQQQDSEGAPLKTLPQLSTEGGPFVVSLKVSSDLLKTGLQLSSSGPSVSSAVLHWLVSCSPAGENIAFEDIPVLSAVCPGGASLRLLAQEVTVSDLCADGPITAVEIRIESSSLAEVCGLHFAVLRHLQTLLKEGVPEAGAATRLKGQSFVQLLQHTEALSKAVQEARGHIALGLGMSSRITEKLLHTYQQLRDSPFLIL
ncbi:FP100 protein, partial [Atractosteus spatula]|nr:FP100 protein [Atractosteus spatula]